MRVSLGVVRIRFGRFARIRAVCFDRDCQFRYILSGVIMPDRGSSVVGDHNKFFELFSCYQMRAPCLQVAEICRSRQKRGVFATTATSRPAFSELGETLTERVGRFLEIICYVTLIDIIDGGIPTLPKLRCRAHPTSRAAGISRATGLSLLVIVVLVLVALISRCQVGELDQEEYR